jgi:hypothetical protein
VKSAERQAALLDHVAPKVRLRREARGFLARQRTRTAGAIRTRPGEFGIVVAKGMAKFWSVVSLWPPLWPKPWKVLPIGVLLRNMK